MKAVFHKVGLSTLMLTVCFALPSLLESQASVSAENADEEMTTNANDHDYNHTPYDEIPDMLRDFEKNSDRVSVEVIGKSAGGHDLYSVVINDSNLGEDNDGNWKTIQEKMLKDPSAAQDWIKEHPDSKVPTMINGSIHGDEYVGTDAALKLIDRFANQNDEETKHILRHNILVFNVVANPDGRINGERVNANGIELNRDHAHQTQPETDALIDLEEKWNPIAFLDLHGYANLVEPTTAPHNPNNEHDLYIKWALDQGEAMEDEIISNKEDYESEEYKNIEKVEIPYRDREAGWDDYPPIFTVGHAMYDGAYVNTIEAPDNTWDGVAWTVNAVMGSLKYTTENKMGMLHDKIEVYKRGVEQNHPDKDNDLYPEAYILPVDDEDPTVTTKAVNHLIKNGIQVGKAEQNFTVNDVEYQAGTYVVNMNQPKAGLANTLLWDGEDVSNRTSAMYDIAAWGLPDMWGFEAKRSDKIIENTTQVKHVENQGELIGDGPYLIPNSSNNAVSLVNRLLEKHIYVYRDKDGNFYVNNQQGSELREAVQKSGLQVKTKTIPDHAKPLLDSKVAVMEGGGTQKGGQKVSLEQLGLNVKKLSPSDAPDVELSDYDVLIYKGSIISDFTEKEYDQFKEHVNKFVSDGNKLIALGNGASKDVKNLGLTKVGIQEAGDNDNAIVHIKNEEDQLLTAGYSQNDIGFAYNPVWYTDLDDQTVITSFAEDNFFKAGFWKNHSKAKDKPVIVKENEKNVVLMGLSSGFRAYPDHLFRLFSNAVYEQATPTVEAANDLKQLVEQLEQEGEIHNDLDSRALNVHLDAVSHYEKKGESKKVIKHLKGFKKLLDAKQQNNLITKRADEVLNAYTDHLIEKWEKDREIEEKAM